MTATDIEFTPAEAPVKAAEAPETDEKGAVARKAYAIATKALKEAHAEEWADLLDAAYASQGEKSPRVKRAEKAAAEAEAREARRVAKMEKRTKRMAELEAELKALKEDPIF